jgi:hypothetical protein
MSEDLRLARPFFVLLGCTAAGRLALGALGVPYARGHHVFSIVILTVFSCLYYGAFLRRLRGYRLMQAMRMGFVIGLSGQVVIFVLTLASYALHTATYFTHPTALNASEALPLAQAMLIRLGGLVGNSISAGIVGALGWAIGGLLPER